MRSNTAYSEEIFTYREIKLLENRRKEELFQKMIQKCVGLFCLVLVLAEFVASRKEWIDEGGLFLIMLPLGLYLLFTKKKAFVM